MKNEFVDTTIGGVQLVRDKILYQYEKFNFQRLTLEIDQGNKPPEETYDLMRRFAGDVIPEIKAQTKE